MRKVGRKRALTVALIAATLLATTVEAGAAPHGSAQAAALIEQSTGRVLYAHQAERELPMASTTKIMTALVTIERGGLDEVVTIDRRMVGVEGSSMYLEEGEQLTVEQLLYGLMLRSGNDAAVALALHAADSVENFAGLMNDRAAQLGLTHTRFVNPHGLPAEGHYTTALDLARITAAAYDAPPFADIVATQRAVVPWQGHDYDRAMRNKNKMLTQYEGGNGVKTGYTRAAGRCLVSGAERGGMQLIAVTLNAPDMWQDSASLLDYGFAHYRMEEALESGRVVAQVPCAFSQEIVPAVAAHAVSLPIREGEQPWIRLQLPENITSTVAQGEILGYAILGVGEEELGRAPLIAGRSVQEPEQFGQALRRVLRGWWRAEAQPAQ